MFSTVRRFIKTAILFLFVGLIYGGWLLYRREILGAWPSSHQVSAHAHVIAVGFVMFLILGVALWMFPRPAKDDRRYRPRRIEAAWWILAPATAVRFVTEAAGPGEPGSWPGWLILAAATGQFVGLALYFYTMWPRIRPVGSQLREEKGEKF